MKKISIIIPIIILISLQISCTKAPEQTSHTQIPVSDNSYDYIKSKGELVIGVIPTSPPLIFKDENENIIGFDVDLAKLVCNKLGVTAKIQQISWAKREEELNNKNIDIIWSALEPDNKTNMLFTEPYIYNNQIILANIDSEITSVMDLKNKNVGVQVKSTIHNAINDGTVTLNLDSGNIVEEENNLSLLVDLKLKKIDAIITDSLFANYYISRNMNSYKIIEDVLLTKGFVVGIRQNENELKDVLNQTLMEIKSEKEIREILLKWFGKENI